MCINDLVVNKYLAHGAFGMVYQIEYQGKPAVLKIIPLHDKDFIENWKPLVHKTEIANFQRL